MDKNAASPYSPIPVYAEYANIFLRYNTTLVNGTPPIKRQIPFIPIQPSPHTLYRKKQTKENAAPHRPLDADKNTKIGTLTETGEHHRIPAKQI